MSQPPLERAKPLDGTLSCQYLFQISKEFQPFVPSYRWWEDESATILWGFQKESCLVIRYALIQDQSILRSILLGRSAEAISTIMDFIKPKLNQCLSHERKVDEILNCCQPPHFKSVPWSFVPSSDQSLDAQLIAQKIETQSHFQLSLIAFEDIVRASLGYTATSVEWFLKTHTQLYVCLWGHLKIHPGEIPVYEEVEKVYARPLGHDFSYMSANLHKILQTQSPFAHRAVLQCLVDLHPGAASDFPRLPMHGFEFIACPIQTLFQKHSYNLTEILKICDVFAFRFQRDYINTAKVPWNKPFDSTCGFLEECFGSSSGLDLARTLTDMDEGDFDNLSQQGIMAQNETATNFLDSWNVLTVSVWEALCAVPDLVPYLQECAQKLFHLRNYHSATAVLYGLRGYSKYSMRRKNPDSTVGEVPIADPNVPPDIGFLIQEDQNYTAYRQYYLQYPGIPFLRPHLMGGESALQPVFNLLRKVPASDTTH